MSFPLLTLAGWCTIFSAGGSDATFAGALSSGSSATITGAFPRRTTSIGATAGSGTAGGTAASATRSRCANASVCCSSDAFAAAYW